jgi:NitT/TauT family transport system permease protein
VRTAVRGLIGVAALLLVWEGVGHSGVVSQRYLPPASTVLARLAGLLVDQKFVLDIVASVLSWAIAMGIAIAIAMPAGLLLGSVPALRAASRVIVEFIRPIPAVALIPLLVIQIGGGPQTKITLAAFAAIWPILFNTIYALDELDPLQVDTARSFGAGRLRVLWSVALPNAAPFVVTGVRISASIALIAVISVELLTGGSGGIGGFAMEAQTGAGRMDLVFAATIVAGAIGFLINAGLEGAQRRWFSWHTAYAEEAR